MMSTQQRTDVNVIAVENNSWSNAALDDEGRVWTWGNSLNTYRLGRVTNASANRENPYNRGAQVTSTIYPGEMLPFILQISGSVENTLALDRKGSVWSWGIASGGALGRSGDRDRPGRVAFPDGVEIKWIAAAYHGGKAIDKQGNIWVWGEGSQYGLGTGRTTDVSSPVMLTLDWMNDPLPTNFVKISSSDYNGHAAAIAITQDGKIFTWGNDNETDRGGATRPRQTGFNADVKKICVGNGAYGFLTNSGEAWTWGDNRTGGGDGRLGHGDTLNLAAPKRIETVANSGTQPAPKFRDFSIYAWSTSAVDYEGNIYGCGLNSNNKHTGVGTPTRLTKYKPNGIPAETEIFVIAEGFTSTSYIDVHGNAYVTGESDARGNNNNDGSPAGPWVHFTGSGKPVFTLLASTPTSESKRYTTLPRTTLNVETNIAADEVKYVILYPEDTEKYSDGETFYSKTFAEIEMPYYLKGTDPQLLLSPNYDLWSSRYYANPKISEDVFNAIYGIKAAPEKGIMDMAAGSGNRAFVKAELVSHNCVVWIQSKNSVGTTRAIYRFDNYYTQTKAWHEGVKVNDLSFNLYPPEVVAGGYGLFLDRQGNLIPGEPPFKYDNVMPMPNDLVYWQLAPADQLAVEKADDGYTHRVDRDKEIFLTELSQKGDDATKTPRVTFTYEKDPSMWVNADLYFVDEKGDSVDVLIDEQPPTHERREMFAPKGIAHVEGQDPYLPPEASNPLTKVVGYSVGTRPDNTEGSYIKCAFPGGFKPVLNGDAEIYIVYKAGMVSVTETFIDISGGTETAIKTNDGLYSAEKNLQSGIDDYDHYGPIISDYVIVGHEITTDDGTEDAEYHWEDDHYEPQNAFIEKIEGNASVRFFYKPDKNANGIPDEEEGGVRVHWIAVNANNAAYQIAQKTLYGNGMRGASITVNEDKETALPTAMYNPDQWLFRPGHLGNEAPYYPDGGEETETIALSAGGMEDVYFYYDEDYNENGIADKLEGRFTEKYKLSPSDGDLTPPKADTTSKWLGGQTYVKEAPLITDYVSVGYVIKVDDNPEVRTERVERPLTGNVAVVCEIPRENAGKNYTVTFLYKEDKNHNNIPDDEEGSVTIRWIGTTYAGNTVELTKLVIEGYIGDEAADMIYQPDSIDEIWKPVDNDVPASITLAAEPQEFTYRYVEVLEFATITVETISTDGNLNFHYQYTKRLTDDAFDVTAFTIPTYRVKGYVLYDNYGNEIASEPSDTIRIDPSTGSRRVVFRYESTITTVVIRAVDADDDTNILQSQTITDAAIGQKYSALAPYVDDTWVLTGDLLQVIDVAEGTNYITFEYEKATGNVTVLLKETSADGSIIGVLSVTVGQSETKDIEIPDLSNAYYTQLSTDMQTVDFTGASPVPDIIEYYYSKDMMDVTVNAVDEADDTLLKTVTHLAAARKGESYSATAPSVQWYTVAESSTKSVYADPAAGGNLTVDFVYKKDDVGDIFVKFTYMDESDSEIVIASYHAKCVVGSKFTALANSFDGFALISADAVEMIISADSEQNRAVFEYNDLRKTVSVYTQIGQDVGTKQEASAHKYVSGSEATILPPYVNDHHVTGYIIDAGPLVEVDPAEFAGLTLSGASAIINDMSILFVYEPVDPGMATITVIGSDALGELYRYSILRPKNSGEYDIEARVVQGYRLLGTTPATIDVADSDVTVAFVYESIFTTVTSYMSDEDTSNHLSILHHKAETGESFTFIAPKIVGYDLTSASEVGSIPVVVHGGENKITFTYSASGQ